jgi:hypothetical protein
MNLTQAQIILTATATILLVFTNSLKAADSSFTTSLTVSEEYNDNVFDSSTNKKSDYITRLLPGIAATHKAPLWDWNLNYALDYRNYAQNSRSDEFTHQANASVLVNIIDEKLFLHVSDVYTRVSLNQTRNSTNDSLSSDQTDQNIGTVSPYLVLRPTTNLIFKTGYRYINTWYRESTAISKQDHVGFVSLTHEFSPKVSITTDYTLTRELPETGTKFYRHDALVGPRYEYAEKSFIFAQGGVTSSNYDDGTNVFQPAWNAGITHTIDTFAVAANAGTSYTDDPEGNSTYTTTYTLVLTKNIKKGFLALNGAYKKYADAQTEQTRTKSYSGGMNSSVEIMPDLNVRLAFSYEKYHDVQLDSYTDRYSGEAGISWLIGKDLNLGLNYTHIDYSSAETATDNYQINRVILEVNKKFL